jgi:hypothetical protein
VDGRGLKSYMIARELFLPKSENLKKTKTTKNNQTKLFSIISFVS